jgi:phospholipase C
MNLRLPFASAMRLPALLAFEAVAALKTTTTIEHVIVIVGENRAFDNLFATYASYCCH